MDDEPKPGPVDLKVCPCCERTKCDVEVRRRNTAYEEVTLNYLTSCLECYEQDYEHFQDLWDEFYRSRL